MIKAVFYLYCMSFGFASIQPGKVSRLISSARLGRGYMAKTIGEDVSEIKLVLSQLQDPQEWTDGVLSFLKAIHKILKLQNKAIYDMLKSPMNPLALQATAENFLTSMEKVYSQLVRSTSPIDKQAVMESLYAAIALCRTQIRKTVASSSNRLLLSGS